jgi:hypothetical protein
MPPTPKLLVHSHEIPSVPWIGGGDPDVYAKPGRRTGLIIQVNNLRITEDGKGLTAHLVYDVREMRADYTNLRYEGDVNIPVPYDWNARVLQFADVTDFDVQTVIVGENHQWNEIAFNTVNSCVQSVRARFDGKGRDDQGNAALQLTFRIPVLVEDLA